MELERYQTLLCAIETGSLTTAAEKLGYTTSGISRMMAALEQEVGFPLLFRKHEGVLPTPECEMLLPAIQDLIHAGNVCMQLSAKIRGLDIGTVVVGTAYGAYYEHISKAIAGFEETHPNITIQIQNGYSTQLLEQLQQHKLDLCIISKRESVSEWFPLCMDEIMAWIPSSHPLAREKEVPISAFATEPYIDIFPGQESDNTRIFEHFHITPNTRFTTADSHSAYEMVSAGLGIAMNNSINGKNRSGSVKILPLSPRQSIEIGIAFTMECSPAASAFLKHLSANLITVLK